MIRYRTIVRKIKRSKAGSTHVVQMGLPFFSPPSCSVLFGKGLLISSIVTSKIAASFWAFSNMILGERLFSHRETVSTVTPKTSEMYSWVRLLAFLSSLIFGPLMAMVVCDDILCLFITLEEIYPYLCLLEFQCLLPFTNSLPARFFGEPVC